MALPMAPTPLGSRQPTMIWSALPTSIWSSNSTKIGQESFRMLFPFIFKASSAFHIVCFR